jgi:hypothetical protein
MSHYSWKILLMRSSFLFNCKFTLALLRALSQVRGYSAQSSLASSSEEVWNRLAETPSMVQNRSDRFTNEDFANCLESSNIGTSSTLVLAAHTLSSCQKKEKLGPY